MNKNAVKYTCLFGGGAIRGAAYAGAVKAINEVGIYPENIAGSSVGSIVAALMAVGYEYKEIKNIFLEVNFDLFRDIQFGFGPKFALSKGELFLDWLRELIERKFYGEKYEKGKNRSVTFKDIDKNLTIITTNISTFECQEFSKLCTPDFEIATAVRISCTMPGLMKPYEYNNTLLVDGDLQKSKPMWMLAPSLMHDDERILEFRLEGDYNSNDKNALDYINTVYSCITAISTSYITEKYGRKDKFDYIVINTGDILIVDFNIPRDKREELMKNGYEQTINYFKKILPQKKEDLLDKYNTTNSMLKKTEKFINTNKIQKAKYTLNELFVKLCEYKNVIDEEIYMDIKNFYESFDSSIKHPALFGKAKLANSETITCSLKNIIKKISDRIFDLESYIVSFPI